MSYEDYLQVCKNASENDEAFKNFKSHPSYNVVLEHVSKQVGLEYLLEINRKNPFLLRFIDKFVTNDKIGNPNVYHTKEIEMAISPTTLRYIKVLGDLMDLWGRLDGMNIVEVGGGYGGQCKIIHDISEPASYTIVDLPEVLALSGKYLKNFNVNNLILRDVTDVSEIHYDLFISNYAFTEIERSYQDFYVEKLIKNSDRGYITCNFFGQRGDGGMSKDEVFALKSDGRFIPEKPLTAPNNIIYVWG